MNCKQILDDTSIARAITRISFEIIERYKGSENLVIVGILSRGVEISKRIAKKISEIEKKEINYYSLDVKDYRDDAPKNENRKKADFDVENKRVILIDDVLYTGRTVRAAIDAIMDIGRPKSIALAALIDRGHRELPIRPDFIGKNVPTSSDEKVKVNLIGFDEVDSVEIIKG